MKVFSVKYIQMITLFKHRFFEVWKEWAQRKAQLRRDSQEFSNQRIQSWVKMDVIYFHDKNDVQLKLLVVYCNYNMFDLQAFQTWRIRQLQMTVIEQKVKVTQAQNMRQLIQSWHYWAKGTVALYFGTML